MRKNSEQSDENKQLAASKLHNVRVSTNGARRRAPVGARLCRCEARATLHTLTSVNQRLTPRNGIFFPRFHGFRLLCACLASKTEVKKSGKTEGSVAQTRRIAASGDENGVSIKI